MKTVISLLLCGLLVLGLAACGSETEEASSKIVITSSAGETVSAISSKKAEVSSQKPETPSSKKQTVTSKAPVSSEEEIIELTAKEKIIYGVDPNMYKTALANAGNSARIAKLMKKAQKGGSYTIGVLGGSITEGAVATSASNRYGNLVLDWWKSNFPKAKFSLINAGIGATNPEMACYRLETDLLSYKPDFVVVDFAVNTWDANHGYDLSTAYSTLLYRILSQKNQPAVMAITFTSVTRESYAAWTFKKAGNYPNTDIAEALEKYNIPTMSYHDYVWAKMSERDENNRKIISWNDIAGDYIHPNNNGHRIAANLINAHLDAVKNKLSSISTSLPAVPKLEYTTYLSVNYITNKTKGVVSSGGFIAQDNSSPSRRGWKYSGNNESTLKIPLPTNSAVLIFMKFDSGSAGSIKVEGANGATNTIRSSAATTPSLVEVPAMGDSMTLTTDLTAGGFTIYGIGVNP